MVLERVLLLVLLLDRMQDKAATGQLPDGVPLLLRRDAQYKSSKEVCLSICAAHA